jgi:hypothetical protein
MTHVPHSSDVPENGCRIKAFYPEYASLLRFNEIIATSLLIYILNDQFRLVGDLYVWVAFCFVVYLVCNCFNRSKGWRVRQVSIGIDPLAPLSVIPMCRA